eukprot:COSAG06_NODE_2430_length_6872_cov_6.208953_4_plen_104_part_00
MWFAVLYATRAVRMGVDVEAQMTYVERVCEFAQLPPEAAASLTGDPPEPWPPLGGIAFEHAELRYRDVSAQDAPPTATVATEEERRTASATAGSCLFMNSDPR